MKVMTYWEYKETQERLSLGAKDDTFTLPDYHKGYLKAVLDSYIYKNYKNVDEEELPRRAYYSDTSGEYIVIDVDEDDATKNIDDARSHGVAWNHFDIQYGWDHKGEFWAVAHPTYVHIQNKRPVDNILEEYVLLSGERYAV